MPAAPAATSSSEADAARGIPIALIRTRLHEVLQLVEARGDAALDGTALTVPLNHLLAVVVGEPGVTVGRIAAGLGKSQQAISQAADRLERLGLLERRIASGRSVGLHPTRSGRAVSREGVEREVAAEDAMRAALGAERFDALYELLVEARDALREPSRIHPVAE